jgi:ferritin-like metal-binding protein YciE
MKGMSGRVAAFGQAVGGTTMTDEVVKGAMSGYAFEQNEVASYTALIAAAGAVGDKETLRRFGRALPQQVEMGRWLRSPSRIATAYMSCFATGREDAKR